MHNQQSGQWVKMRAYLNSSGSRDCWENRWKFSSRLAGTGFLRKGGHARGSTCKLLAAVVLVNQGSWFQLAVIRKGYRTIPLNIFFFLHQMKFMLKPQGCLAPAWGHRGTTETWRGWERKTEEERWPMGMSKKERKGRENVHSRSLTVKAEY